MRTSKQYVFKIRFDTTQRSMVDNFCYHPTINLFIKLGGYDTIKMEVKLLVFSIFIFFSLCLSISDLAGNGFTVDQFWHDQWQAVIACQQLQAAMFFHPQLEHICVLIAHMVEKVCLQKRWH